MYILWGQEMAHGSVKLSDSATCPIPQTKQDLGKVLFVLYNLELMVTSVIDASITWVILWDLGKVQSCSAVSGHQLWYPRYTPRVLHILWLDSESPVIPSRYIFHTIIAMTTATTRPGISSVWFCKVWRHTPLEIQVDCGVLQLHSWNVFQAVTVYRLWMTSKTKKWQRCLSSNIIKFIALIPPPRHPSTWHLTSHLNEK